MSAYLDLPPLIGESASFMEVLDRVSALAAVDRPVLVVGERGTGKELVAARLHFLSPRWDRAHVRVNAAALPESLLESELFGHEAGAFTGAVRRRAGRFEQADGGTLFLDEIALASARVQERLLRVVEYGEFERLGASASVRVDVRLIAATNLDLPTEAAAGRFRHDLLDRLAFDVVTLPPLRARSDDISRLAAHFGRAMASELGWESFPGFSEEVEAALLAHSWPGNVRELRNVVERSVHRWPEAQSPIGMLVLDPFASPWRPPAATKAADAAKTDEAPPLPERLDQALAVHERALLTRALEETRHNQRRAAARLGLSYDQLRHRLRKHGLS